MAALGMGACNEEGEAHRLDATVTTGSEVTQPGPDTTSSSETVDEVATTLTFEIEPITVPPGTERQVCRTVNIPAGAALDIVRFTAEMDDRSHHFNVYKVISTKALDPVSPDDAVTHDCAPGGEQLSGDAAYIFGSATPNRVMDTPPGVAFHLEPGQRLILEYHAINYTQVDQKAGVKVHFQAASPGAVIEHHAEIFWFANWHFMLPPGVETTSTAQCEIPYNVEIFGLMSHFHGLGTHFVVNTLAGGKSTGVYEDEDFAHPKYEAFDPPIALNTGDQIQWTCTWFNSTSETVMPERTSKDEMCIVFAAGYPRDELSAAPAQCNIME